MVAHYNLGRDKPCPYEKILTRVLIVIQYTMSQESALAIPFRKFLALAVIEHAVFALAVLSILMIVQAIPFHAVLLFLFAFSILGIPLSAGIAWMIARGSNWVNARAASIALGIIPGQVYGLLFGGLVGFRQWGTMGGIISAVFLFAAGSWAGAKLAVFLYDKYGVRR